MSDLETTQSKLQSTPTAGVAGEHSAYYRRLLSAGYKGHIQGMIGGSTLYGAMGLIIGAAVAIPATIFLGPAVLLAIPALGGIGVLHGAHMFSDIGTTAAIIAESADTNEKRRYLLDRYYDTPSDEEAKAIKTLLETQMTPPVPDKMFHWKTVAVGAALGLAFTLGFMLLAASPATATLIGFHLSEITGILGLGEVGTGIGALATGTGAALLAIGTAVGTLAGGMIGIDREYIRRWLDHAEFAVHDQTDTKSQIAARAQEVELLADPVLRKLRQHPGNTVERDAAPTGPNPPTTPLTPPTAIASAVSADASLSSDQPKTRVTAAESHDRVVNLAQAIHVPAI